jgi:hypothetical protein
MRSLERGDIIIKVGEQSFPLEDVNFNRGHNIGSFKPYHPLNRDEQQAFNKLVEYTNGFEIVVDQFGERLVYDCKFRKIKGTSDDNHGTRKEYLFGYRAL